MEDRLGKKVGRNSRARKTTLKGCRICFCPERLKCPLLIALLTSHKIPKDKQSLLLKSLQKLQQEANIGDVRTSFFF
jgi:hypothetical protein